MQSITQDELVERVRQKADMENSTFVSESEIVHILNDKIDRLYGDMVNVDDGKLFATVAPTLTQIGTHAYQLPSDFMRLVDVNVYTGTRWVCSLPADPQEYYQLLSRSYEGDYDTYHFLRLNPTQSRYELFLFPAKVPDNIGVRYVPEAPRLTGPTSSISWPSAWHEAFVTAAAADCLVKEESDPTALMQEYANLRERCLRDVRTQSVSEVKTLRDISSRNRHRGRTLWRY